MAKIELILKQTYRPHWGRPEAVREFVQNWLDGHDQGYEKSLYWDNGWLVLRNDGVVLPREALLLGFTTKADDERARGQWGEGLDMGLLVATRAGLRVKVLTGSESWTPRLCKSSSFDDEVLCVFTRRIAPHGGTEVHIHISEREWGELRWRFLDLLPPQECESYHRGKVIFDEDRKGCVYVKGIFVSRMEGLLHGYDFSEARVDLDRMLVDGFDVRWEAANMWRTVISRNPERHASSVWQMLCEERDDVKGLGVNLRGSPDTKVAEAIANAFMEKHGEDALPVVDDDQEMKLKRIGRHAVRVPRMAGDVLEAFYGSFFQMFSKVSRQEKTEVPFINLCIEEQQVVERGIQLVSLAIPNERSYHRLRGSLAIVDYQDPKILGTWDSGGGECCVARKVLTDVPSFLETYIHELSHDLTGVGDGHPLHISMAEWIWSRVCAVLLGRTGMEWLDGARDGEVRNL